MACKKCGKPSYSDLCYRCRGKENKGEIAEVRNDPDHIKWYKELLAGKSYNTSEIHGAFALLWCHVRDNLHPMDKWRFNKETFSERLKRAFDMGYIPTTYYFYADKIVNEQTLGDGWELLQSLGFMKPDTISDPDIKEVL